MGVDYRHVRLNEATGIFEEVPTPGRRIVSVFRCLAVPFRWSWAFVSLSFALVCWAIRQPFRGIAATGKGIWWILCLPFRGGIAVGRWVGERDWNRILNRGIAVCTRPLGLLFAPVVWWWRNEREAYCEDDWFMVVILLLPGYLIFLAYKYLLLLLVALGGELFGGILVWAWQFVSALAVWLWQLACAVSVWLWMRLEEAVRYSSPVVAEWLRGLFS